MRVMVIRHHQIDDAGFIGAAFAERGAEVSVHLFPADGPLPPLDGIDHIVVLGAAWSVYDNDAVGDWIGAELSWLRAADAAGTPVLGICFGAQALSMALGGDVRPAPRKEIGWITIESLDTELIEEGPWLAFHGDQCVPPTGARVLARTPVCVQAFTVGRHLAVQFHPEVDGSQLSRWLSDGGASEAQAEGQDPDRFVTLTIAQEPHAARRASRLVATALRLAAAAVVPAVG